MSEDQIKKINDTLNGLKDFQRNSVNYIYENFYGKTPNRNRVLIADEVGLGKTIIAKGLIAKAYQKYSAENKKLHAVYICSNQALARQNLSKLDILNTNDSYSFGRLTFLAFKNINEHRDFQINTLTPSTSFKITKSTGLADERAIIFTLLNNYKVFNSRYNEIRRILRGTSSCERWSSLIEDYDKKKGGYFTKEIYQQYRKALMNESFDKEKYPRAYANINTSHEISIWTSLRFLADKLKRNKSASINYSTEIISALRTVLTNVTVGNLDADLFILDEFQRFKDLIDTENNSDAGMIAKAVFNKKDARILMLSATPFKPYTDKFDNIEGEDHYKELTKIMKFLLENKDDAYWNKFDKDRKAFFELLRDPKTTIKNIDEAVKVKNQIEKHYRNVISRNERASVTEDGKTMVKEFSNIIEIKAEDIQDYINIDDLARKVNSHIKESRKKIKNPIEFAKSVPFPLSFSNNYSINIEIKNKVKEGSIKIPNKGFLNTTDINAYKPILSKNKKSLYPNGKIRDLIDSSLYTGAYNYLWIPPSFPYYEPYGAYENSLNYSKTLVFSSWAMVPRALSSILSYEAERLTIGEEDTTDLREKSKRKYFLKKRFPRPLLTFSLTNGEVNNMYNFCILYPSVSLSEIIGIKNINQYNNHESLLTNIETRISEKLEGIKGFQKKDTIDPRWYWVAPLLLDKVSNSSGEIKEWLKSRLDGRSITVDAEDKDDKKRNSKGKDAHIKHFRTAFDEPKELELGKMPEDLPHVLAQLSISSPAITANRSLKNLFKDISVLDIVKASYHIAEGFFTLFNKPESISIIRSNTKDNSKKGYWYNTILYSLSGNIQSLIDEYAYMLFDNGGFNKDIEKLAEQFNEVMSIRSSPISIETKNTLSDSSRDKKSLRAHFALNFGTQKIESASGENRIVNIRDAFNSPFRPFVLASTSIGQEGLDFHYYCRKITHWNLPSNAIDIEQREGRINRYKGLVIRQNIVKKYNECISFDSDDIWSELFALAEKDAKKEKKNDMIPFWHLNDNLGISIERRVPLHPFSKDVKKYENLKKTLAIYRLTFGQPRQEELVESLNETLNSDEIEIIRKNLIIDLSPKK